MIILVIFVGGFTLAGFFSMFLIGVFRNSISIESLMVFAFVQIIGMIIMTIFVMIFYGIGKLVNKNSSKDNISMRSAAPVSLTKNTVGKKMTTWRFLTYVIIGLFGIVVIMAVIPHNPV